MPGSFFRGAYGNSFAILVKSVVLSTCRLLQQGSCSSRYQLTLDSISCPHFSGGQS